MNEKRRSVRIALTETQRRQVWDAIGKDAVAVEVGSEGPDDEWIVLVREPGSSNEGEETGGSGSVFRCRGVEEPPTSVEGSSE